MTSNVKLIERFSNQSLVVKIDPNDSIIDLKQRLSQILGVPVKNLAFSVGDNEPIGAGRNSEIYYSLRDYKISSLDANLLGISENQIVAYPTKATVGDVRQIIARNYNVDPNHVEIIIPRSNKLAEDDEVFSDLEKFSKGILNLNIETDEDDEGYVFAKSLDDDKIVGVLINESSTFGEYKALLSEKVGKDDVLVDVRSNGNQEDIYDYDLLLLILERYENQQLDITFNIKIVEIDHEITITLSNFAQYVRGNGDDYTIEVRSTDTVKDLKQKFSNIIRVPVENILLLHMRGGVSGGRLDNDDQIIGSINDNHLLYGFLGYYMLDLDKELLGTTDEPAKIAYREGSTIKDVRKLIADMYDVDIKSVELEDPIKYRAIDDNVRMDELHFTNPIRLEIIEEDDSYIFSKSVDDGKIYSVLVNYDSTFADFKSLLSSRIGSDLEYVRLTLRVEDVDIADDTPIIEFLEKGLAIEITFSTSAITRVKSVKTRITPPARVSPIRSKITSEREEPETITEVLVNPEAIIPIEHLLKYGWMVVKEVIIDDEVGNILLAVNDILKVKNLEFNYLGEAICVGAQSSFMWSARFRAKKVFSYIWDNDDLKTSFESFRLGDQMKESNELIKPDNNLKSENVEGITCVRGFINISGYPGFSVNGVGVVNLEPGDMVLWDHRLTCSFNRTNEIGLFICMIPRSDDYKPQIMSQVQKLVNGGTQTDYYPWKSVRRIRSGYTSDMDPHIKLSEVNIVAVNGKSLTLPINSAIYDLAK